MLGLAWGFGATTEGEKLKRSADSKKRRQSRMRWLTPVLAGTNVVCGYLLAGVPNVNMSIKSPMAGLFTGTYGLLAVATGLGKLSRLRLVTGFNPQLASMNFKTET